MKALGITVPMETMLLALVADRLAEQMYQYAKAHGANNASVPQSIVELLRNKEKQPKENAVFDSGEDFAKAWNKITGA